MDPLRGEVWDASLPIVGQHPVVVLTINQMTTRLASVTVAVITGTPGPPPTHIGIGAESGVTKYDVSYVNSTDLHTVAKTRLRRRRGLLHPAELRRLESAVRTYLGL